ncbi:MAG: hypothetical protein V2J26_05100 [Pacificimonas sp.]|jgi:hypothetical protein|nr:hypothetical protein [Pacificimonas sp.]
MKLTAAPALFLLSACAVAVPFETSRTTTEAVSESAPEGAASSPADRAELAFRLASLAREDGDADALLTAARLMLNSGTRAASLEGGGLAPVGGADPLVRAWANEAVLIADADPAVAERAEALMALAPRGIVATGLGNGPLRYVQRLDMGETLSLGLQAEPGRDSSVAAIGDGDARLALSVRAGAASVCTLAARTTHRVCSWRAAQAEHDVSLRNAGPLSSEVMLLSN